MTLLLGMCGDGIAAIAADSFARKADRVPFEATKVMGLAGRFAIARCGGNGSILDPVRFDFDGYDWKTGPPPLRDGQRAGQPREDVQGQSDWATLMRRYERSLPEQTFDDAWLAYRSHNLGLLRAELQLVKNMDWNMEPWEERHWMAGIDSDGCSRLVQAMFVFEDWEIHDRGDFELRHGRQPDPKLGMSITGSGNPYAGRILESYCPPVRTEQDAMTVADVIVGGAITACQEEDEDPTLAGPVRLVVVTPDALTFGFQQGTEWVGFA